MRVAVLIAALLACPCTSFAQAQLSAIVSGGFSAPYREVLPEFERATGIKVTTTSGPSLLPIAGVDFVGTLPADIQKVNIYAAAIVAGSKEVEAARRLIAFLASTAATDAITKSGMAR